MKNLLNSTFLLPLVLCVSAVSAGTVTLTFENGQLGTNQQLTSVNSYWNGSHENTEHSTATPNGNYKTSGDSTPLAVSGVNFSNSVSYDSNYRYWSWIGFGVSNAAGTFTTGGQTAEMYAYPTSGAHGGSNYLVGYTSSWTQDACVVTFPGTVTPQSVYVANAAWTALGAKNGDDFCNGLIDGDSISLKIYGGNGGTYAETPISFDLAYKKAGSEKFVLSDWQSVDLTSLGNVDSLKFELEVTGEDYGGVIGEWGANVATYFALDNLAYQTSTPEPPSPGSDLPEPATWVLLMLGSMGLWISIKRK